VRTLFRQLLLLSEFVLIDEKGNDESDQNEATSEGPDAKHDRRRRHQMIQGSSFRGGLVASLGLLFGLDDLVVLHVQEHRVLDLRVLLDEPLLAVGKGGDGLKFHEKDPRGGFFVREREGLERNSDDRGESVVGNCSGGVEGRSKISDVGLELPSGDQDVSLDSVLAAEGSIEDEADGDFFKVKLPEVFVLGGKVDGLGDVDTERGLESGRGGTGGGAREGHGAND